MDLREHIIVNEVVVKLQPYTELRAEQLTEVNNDVDEYAEKQPEGFTFQEMSREDKARFWMRKAKILWLPQPDFDREGRPSNLKGEYWDKKEKFFTKEFFEDKAFEYPLLQKSEAFFLTQEVYL